jgi:hypothetical protein
MNQHDRGIFGAPEAEVRYAHGDFKVVRNGGFVRCAVTGQPIPLEDLKYWSVELQEAYADPAAALARLRHIKAETVFGR